MRRCAAIAGLCLLASISTPRARAQERLPLELDWQAPAPCPSADAVRDEVQRIARVRPGFSLTPLRARAAVEQRGTSYVTTLHTEHEGQAGERALQAADCAALARAVTLVLALAFGAGVEVADPGTPAATAPEPEPSSATTPSAPVTPAPVTPAPEPDDDIETTAEAELAASAAARERALHWSLLAGGGVQFGLLPAAAFAASAAAEMAVGSFSIGLRANAWPGVTDAIAARIDARYDGLGGALQGCGRLPWSALVLAACAEARAAALRGRSSGATEDDSATAPWYALAAAASITWPSASVLSLRVQAALAASLNRPRFVITGLQQVHRVPQLAPDVSAFLVVTP